MQSDGRSMTKLGFTSTGMRTTLEFDTGRQCWLETNRYDDGKIYIRPIDVNNIEELEAVTRRVDYAGGYAGEYVRPLTEREKLINQIESYPTDSMEEQDFLDSIVFNLRSGG